MTILDTCNTNSQEELNRITLFIKQSLQVLLIQLIFRTSL